MHLLQNPLVINQTSIPLILQWWQHRKRLATARLNVQTTVVKGVDEAYLKAYQRLTEIYSVVKAGGVQAQVEATRAYFEREAEALQQALAALPADSRPSAREHIEREMQELGSATRWRLDQIKDISLSEEAAVRQSLLEIERSLMSLQSA